MKTFSQLKRMMLIFNPVSGRRASLRFLPDIISIFSQNGYAVTVFPTAHACAQQRLHEKTADSLTAGREALYVYRPLNGQRFTYASAGQSARAASSAMTMTSRWSCRIDAGT